MGTGALKRREPVGGWAKGIPSQLSVTLETVWPRKVPEVKRSCKGSEAAATYVTASVKTKGKAEVSMVERWIFSLSVSLTGFYA